MYVVTLRSSENGYLQTGLLYLQSSQLDLLQNSYKWRVHWSDIKKHMGSNFEASPREKGEKSSILLTTDFPGRNTYFQVHSS